MLSLDTNYLLDDKSNIKRQSRCLLSLSQMRSMITSVLSPYCCRKNTSLYLDHLQLLYKEDLIHFSMRPCIVSRHPTLNYFKITLLLSMHITSHPHHNQSCISIIEDHNHFCVPSNHHPNTNAPPHIQLLLDNGRHFFYPQNITTHTTTM